MQDCCDKMICLYSLLFWNLTAYSWYRSTLQTYVFLGDINQFGQSIYHFIESPRLIDFKNTKIIWNFDVASCHIAQRSINWLPVLSRSIAAYEQRHMRRTIQPEVFPNLLVHQSICNIFSTHCTVPHLFMTQSSWANLDYITFEVLRCD